MARSIVWNVVLPVLIFMPMSYIAFQLLMGRVVKAGLLNLYDQCPTPSINKPPYQLDYLGGYAPQIENTLCVLVGFFDVLFQPVAAVHLPFLEDFFASLAAPVVVPVLESTRANRPYLLALPVVFGIVYQNIGGGVVFPAYFAIFLATTRNKAAGSQIDKTSARAVLFGLVTGYVLPSVAMFYTGEKEVIAFWQAFPLWVSVFQYLYILVGPRRSTSGSGYGTVQVIYVSIFIVSAVVHVRSMAAYDYDPQRILDAFVPTLAIPDAKKGHTGLTSAIHFLQWDFVFIYGSTLLASLWFAQSLVQGVLLTVWSVLATVALGPGAAISGAFLWREARLKRIRQKQVPAIKASKAQ